MTGTEMRVRHARDQWDFPARDLYSWGAREVRHAGHGNPVFDELLRFLWVEDEAGAPIGFLAYSYDWLDEEVSIELSYVHPDHRRKGVYKALYKRLVKIALRLKAATIVSGIHEQNQVMIEAARATGRKLKRVPGDPFVCARHYLRADGLDAEAA